MTGYSFRLTGNRKVGPIPVTRSPQKNCPASCSLRGNGCYAENAPLVWAWQKDHQPWEELLWNVSRLAKNQLWRHNEAGDLQTTAGGDLDKDALDQLVKANRGKRGFTYTHHNPFLGHNLERIGDAIWKGFAINVSADNMEQADFYWEYDLPVVVVLPLGAPNVSYTPAGNKVVACPAEKSERVTCATCAMCQKTDRPYIIGFRAHGSRKKLVSKIALKEI